MHKVHDHEVLVQQFIESGGQITQVPAKASGLNWRGQDWARAARGEKVASAAEIDAERERRLLKAVANQDIELTMKLLQGQFDREIKFDIENGRLGPNGEIR